MLSDGSSRFGGHRSASFLLGFEGAAPEDVVSGQRAASEKRPHYGLNPGAILFQSQIGEIPEGEGPDNDAINANGDQDQREDDEDSQDASGEAFKKEHAPVLARGIGAPGHTWSRALD